MSSEAIFLLIMLPYEVFIVVGGIMWLDVDRYRLLVKWYEVFCIGVFIGIITDRRDPRSHEITVLKRQIKLLRGNSSEEAKAERETLKAELKSVRQEAVDSAVAIRKMNDLAKYQLHKLDITKERALREHRTRLISEMDEAELNARRESYELE